MLSRPGRTPRAIVGAVGVALLVAACSSTAGAPGPVGAASAPATSRSPSGESVGVAGNALPPVGAPALDPGVPAGASGVAVSGGGSASAGTAVAYPFYGGAPAVAPEHTIVVSGYGQASMRADGADRAQAAAKALGTALADARAQADQVASTAGVTIIGVYSISVAGTGYAYPLPMAASGTAPAETPPAPVEPSAGAAGAATGAAGAAGGALPEPVANPPTAVDYGVSVTVAYTING